MDIVFGSDENFNELYLYLEPMEADLQAIVRRSMSLPFLSQLNKWTLPSSDSFWPTPLGRAPPVFHLPNALRSEVHPLG